MLNLAISQNDRPRNATSRGRIQADGKGSSSGSSGFSNVAVHGLPSRSPASSMASAMSTDRVHIAVPRSHSACCATEFVGRPNRKERDRTGGGPPGRNLTREKLEQTKPEWYPSQQPRFAASRSAPHGSAARRSAPSRLMSLDVTSTAMPWLAASLTIASPSPNGQAGPEKWCRKRATRRSLAGPMRAGASALIAPEGVACLPTSEVGGSASICLTRGRGCRRAGGCGSSPESGGSASIRSGRPDP
eukprot:12895842-Heterocapsa_arctica.AAC.1